MRKVISNKFLKILFLVLFSGLIIFGLIDILDFAQYNQRKEALAQGEKPINCKRQSEFKLPSLGIKVELGPNELEIPIGETTDKTENIGQTISRELQEMILAVDEEINAAREISKDANDCSLRSCTTRGCGESGPGCSRPMCQGNACPHKAEIDAKLNEIRNETKKISDAYAKINNIFVAKRNKPIGQWWCNCLLSVGQCVPPPGECQTDREIILDKLEKSRSGDYQFYNILKIPPGLDWNHQPPGLKDCVLRPEDLEAVLRGEAQEPVLTGRYLMDCKTAISAGLIDEDSCYGQVKCESEVAKGKEPPEDWLCPRMENYYCCE